MATNNEMVTETYPEALNEGFWGNKVDPLPNDHYTVEGLDPMSAPPPPPEVKLGKTIETLEEAQEAGYFGTAVDPRPNEDYTVAGSIARKDELFEAPPQEPAP